MLKFRLVFRSGTRAVSVVLDTGKQCLWLSICHKLLVEGNAPKPLLNTEFHSVAARSPNAFSSVPGAPFWSIGVRESFAPFCYVTWKPGWQNTTPFFPFRDGCDGRNGAGRTPQNIVATVASVALYPITSNAVASTTM